MKLTILFDHRFHRDSSGIVFSPTGHNYPQLSKRYHKVFPFLRVLARVSEAEDIERKGRSAEGDNIEIVSMGNWNGSIGFISKKGAIATRLEKYLNDDTAVILIAFGMIGTLGYRTLLRTNHPYGVVVIGDPYESLAPGCVKHPLRSLFRHWFAHQLRVQCRDAAGVLYVTENALQKRYPASPGTFTTYCSDVELTDFCYSEPRSYSSLLPKPITLLNVSLMAQPYKGHDDMIDALALCVEKGLDLRLVLVGDGAYRNAFAKRAQSRGLEGCVVFRGLLPAGDAVRAELDRADLFLLPSRTEGLPRALVEAMARGLPCIGSTVGGIPELLHPDDRVPPGNPQALAQKIEEILASPARLEAMSLRNRKKADEFRFEILAERRTAFYRHIAGQTEKWMRDHRSNKAGG